VLSSCWRSYVLPSGLHSSSNPATATLRSRRVRPDRLYVDKSRSNMHLGGEYNLNTEDGVRDALAELEGVRRALISRGHKIEKGDDVEELSSEESWKGFSDDDSDDDEMSS
jgi:hypothetical protein